jgi:glycerophosphoryl diester phosphodiesterase
MLSGHDINYYLALKPPVFKWAVALVGLVGLGYIIALSHLAAGVVLSLPILIFESASPASSLRESRRRSMGQRKKFAIGFFIWMIVVLLVGGITTAIFIWIGRLLAPALLDQTVLLMIFFGGFFLFSTLIQLLINMAATTSLSLLVVEWYRPLSPWKPDLERGSTAGINGQNRRSPHFSRRLLITGTLVAFILALATGWLLLSNADLNDRTEVMAHRGASASAPENTMAAIVRAISDGAHWVEIDVQRTADDAVVVIHDRDLMKIGGEPIVVSESRLEKIVAKDVGSWFAPKFANQRIPTLEEVLKKCKNKIKVNIELKYYGWDERLAKRVVDIVEKAQMDNDIVIMSLEPKAIRQVKNMRPEWQVGLLSAAALTDIVGENADFLAVHSRMASPGFVKQVHDAGKRLYVWTVNDAVGMMQMFDLGVDALITDKPDLAIRLMGQRATLNPAERVLLAAGFLILGEPEHSNPAKDGFQFQMQKTDGS